MHRQIKWLRLTQLFEDRKSHKIYHSFCSSVPTIALTDQCTWHLKMKHHLLNNTSGTKHVWTPWLYFDLHLPHLILGTYWYTLSRYFGYRGIRSNFRAQFRHQVNTLPKNTTHHPSFPHCKKNPDQLHWFDACYWRSSTDLHLLLY